MRKNVTTKNGAEAKGWKGRRVELSVTLCILALSSFLFSRFVMWVEERSGVMLDDPVLRVFSPFDLTWPIFVVIYGGLLFGVVTLFSSPSRLLLTMQSYALLLLVRIVAMYTAPFAPPQEMIVLLDPVAGLGPGGAMTNDLFFSGHTATLFLFVLTARKRSHRIFFLVLTIALGAMLLIQHVHYTVDVLAAPFFSFGCFALVRKVRGSLNMQPTEGKS